MSKHKELEKLFLRLLPTVGSMSLPPRLITAEDSKVYFDDL